MSPLAFTDRQDFSGILKYLSGVTLHACSFTYPDTIASRWVPKCEGISAVLTLPEALAHSVPKRKAEYLAGRYCAAKAIYDLQGQWHDIPMASSGLPLWPEGIIGSITHTQCLAACVVQNNSGDMRLGLDLEELMSDGDAARISSHVLDADEELHKPPQLSFSQFISLVFSAKETAFKCLWHVEQRFIHFDEMQVIECLDHCIRLKPRAESTLLNRGDVLDVHYTIKEKHVMTISRVSV